MPRARNPQWKVIARSSQSGNARQLVVITHGLGTTLLMADVRELAAEVFPDADQLFFNYNSGMYSNLHARDASYALSLKIQSAVEEKAKHHGQYESIILIGHSIGALLLRAAYLIATGHRFHRIDPAKHSWADRVTRMVLLAGLNNGWQAPTVEGLGNFGHMKSALITLQITHASLTRSAQMMLSVMRGSEFVADVRLNWLQMVQFRPQLEPQVVQLKGHIDDLITGRDINDFVTGANFKYRVVPDASHFDLGVMSAGTAARAREEISGRRGRTSYLSAKIFGWLMPDYDITDASVHLRRSEISQALVANWDDIASQIPQADQPVYGVKHVAIIRHGIRDHSHGWAASLASKLTALDPGIREIATEKTSFGRFSMIQFLIRGARLRRVQDFIDQYINLRARYPGAAIHFIGHSYGTYLCCRALRDHKACRFESVVLANSVVASDYPWSDVLQAPTQVKRILNLRGSSDCVVAWFPGAFQSLRETLGIASDGLRGELLGSAGFSAFHHDKPLDVVVKGGHDAGIQEKYLDAIAEFVISGKPVKGYGASPSSLIGAIARIPFAAWIAIPLCVLAFLALWMQLPIWISIGFTALVTICLVPILHLV